MNQALCLTLGEQSENHVGMTKHGSGLATNGYSINDLQIFKNEFEKINCECEYLNLSTDSNLCDASVLIIRDCVNIICNNNNFNNLIFNEISKLEWDTKYYENRRKKVLNKNARYNLCFGNKSISPDYNNKQGTVISYDKVPCFKTLKLKIENILNENNLESEGNFYYNAKKCGIGFHGDSERKKVIGCSFSTHDIIREIRWQWYLNGERVNDPFVVKLNNGDCYIMSEKASGFDWKKKKIYTLRHAAGVEGNKYLK